MSRLVIVDHQELVRVGLKTTLAGERNLEIVGEAADIREALEVCRCTCPDLVLMEVNMPDMDGLAATRRIKHHLPGVSVLILTVHRDHDCMWEAIKAGASGYMLKDAPPNQLSTAIRKVLCGEVALTRSLANQLLQRLASEAENEAAAKRRPETGQAATTGLLTPRELEVLELLALGQTNHEIARNLSISPGTVKNHIQRIKTKLEASDRTQAVVRGLELELIRLPSIPKAI